MIKVGVIGFGKMGRLRYDVIRKDGRGCVVGVVDPYQSVSLPEVQVYPTAEELIYDPRIEGVFICTPNYLNYPLTLQALQAGKHVFCEKPPAIDAKEVEEIIAVERQRKQLKLMYGFNHRHHESVKKAKACIDSGAYGCILWMRGRYGKSVDQNFYHSWRAQRKMAGGGILIDQGIHMLDLFLMLAGDFEEAKAYVSNLYWNLNVEDNVFAMLRNREGVVASLHSTMTQWRHLFSLEVFLEKGYIVINGLLTASGTYGDEVMTVAKNRTSAPAAIWNDEEHFKFKVDTSWSSEVSHFLTAIEQDQPIQYGNSRDALKLMRVVNLIYQSV